MKKILWFLDHFEEVLATILLGITFIAFGLQIVFRLAGIPGSKLSELYQYTFLVSLMFGISYANRNDEHIRADILTSRVSPKVKFVMEILGDVVAIFFGRNGFFRNECCEDHDSVSAAAASFENTVLGYLHHPAPDFAYRDDSCDSKPR